MSFRSRARKRVGRTISKRHSHPAPTYPHRLEVNSYCATASAVLTSPAASLLDSSFAAARVWNRRRTGLNRLR